MEKVVIFYVWSYGNMARITTGHTEYRKFNSACICDLRTMLDTMDEIRKETEKDGFTAHFVLEEVPF